MDSFSLPHANLMTKAGTKTFLFFYIISVAFSSPAVLVSYVFLGGMGTAQKFMHHASLSLTLSYFN